MFTVQLFHPPAFLCLLKPIIDFRSQIIAVPSLKQTSLIQGELRSSRFGAVCDHRYNAAGKASIQDMASISASAA